MFENEYRALMEDIAPGQELVAATQARMKERMDGGRRAPRMRRGAILLAALFVLGVIGASAFALTQARLTDWNGNQIMAEPNAHDVNPAVQDALLARMINAPDDELWVARTGAGSWSYHYPKEAFSSLDALVQRIKASDPALLTPTVLPQGYHFVSGLIWFYASRATRDAGLAPLGEETVAEGVVLKKFRLPDGARNDIQSYHMGFQNDEGTWFYVSCGREDASFHYFFPAGEEGSSEAVALAGMAKGLYSREQNQHTLRLLKTDVKIKAYYPWPLRLDDSGIVDGTHLFDAAEYLLEGMLDKEQLLNIAQGLQ